MALACTWKATNTTAASLYKQPANPFNATKLSEVNPVEYPIVIDNKNTFICMLTHGQNNKPARPFAAYLKTNQGVVRASLGNFSSKDRAMATARNYALMLSKGGV